MGTDPECVGGKLCQHRMGALALRRRAGQDHDPARRADPHRGTLERAAAGAFHIVREPDPDEPSLAPRSLPPGREVRIACRRERAALTFRIVAAVIGHRQAVAGDDRRDVGHLLP